eukprot:CAMPEP_0113851604 /NCGR_PEP_ID=MMETSP0372-20130328/4776_1 /TAXON_ID=340204 /ORGANISM="Lankesteria abbotti" /LENGTH=293 /DNA_ID=CAMNT_0000822519 /DNA_START=19 /DNA_END=900 /DNA_ORIENTATION=- /assembly_acc=CAM_ASM_000359
MEENSGSLHDEIVAHRLGLLPIDSTKVDSFKYRQECSCIDKCPKCCVEYHLDIACNSDSRAGLTVTHHDLIGRHSDQPMPIPRPETDTDTLQNGIVITKLKKNQNLKCQIVGQKGLGKLHAKFIPVAKATWQYEADIILDQRRMAAVSAETKQMIYASCPKSVFAYDDDPYTGQSELTVSDRMACVFCNECVNVAKDAGHKDFVRIKHVVDKFHFCVESTGALPADQIIEKAFEVLYNKLTRVRKAANEAQGQPRADSDDEFLAVTGGKFTGTDIEDRRRTGPRRDFGAFELD